MTWSAKLPLGQTDFHAPKKFINQIFHDHDTHQKNLLKISPFMTTTPAQSRNC